MKVVRFGDGTTCRLGVVHGDRFEPREGETFLFEFPDGRLKEGTVNAPVTVWSDARVPVRSGVYDCKSRVVSLEV